MLSLCLWKTPSAFTQKKHGINYCGCARCLLNLGNQRKSSEFLSSSRSEDAEARVAQMRELAELVTDQKVKKTLLEIAETYLRTLGRGFTLRHYPKAAGAYRQAAKTKFET